MSSAEPERVTIAALYRTGRALGAQLRWGAPPLHTEAAGASHPEAFGPFRVLHQIGAGALGPVFRAYDPDQDRLVAVKAFQLDLPPDRLHTLVAQLQALIDADLTHPVIAAPIATGIAETTAYLALDFVADDSADVSDRGHGLGSAAEAVRIVSQLAAALDFAVDANVAHGALHPRDVLLSTGDARLTGVGIAQVLERVGLSTPIRRPYTAPERAAGVAWDRRSDVFSLAAIGHELLWGRGISSTGEEAAAVLTAFGGADLGALRRVFDQALAADPADRFESATEFAEGLRRALTAGMRSTQSVGRARTPIAPRTPPARHVTTEEISPEPRLPLDDDASGDERRNRFAVPMVLAPSEERASVDPPLGDRASNVTPDEIDATLSDAETRPAGVPLLALDLRNHGGPDRDHEISIVAQAPTPVSPSVLTASDAAAERTHSAVWPLIMALGVGLAVGFALGYSVAEREQPAVALHSGAPSAVLPDTAPAAGVSETEVRLKPVPPPAVVDPARAADNPPPPQAAAAPAAGRLLIRSTPAGAAAFVDGRAVGRTPLTERDVRPGSHTVRVTREGFVAQERRVSVSTSRPFQTVSFDLAPTRPVAPPSTPSAAGRASGAITIDSRPAGASVIVDGKVVGTTPTTLDQVTVGTHTIVLELADHRRWSTSVKVVAGERQRVAASLER